MTTLSPTPRPGQLIADRYELIRHLGFGGSSTVWSARDAWMDADEVLKLMARGHPGDQQTFRQLKREAQILTRLDHPNIASFLGIIAAPPSMGLVIELVDGVPLSDAMGLRARSRRPLSAQQVREIVVGLCFAVAHAHERGVVHRDIKPQNVILAAQGDVLRPVVLDFGVARLMRPSQETSIAFAGSLFYLSPEQLCNEKVDERADVFAIGSIVYELLTLRRAWARDVHGRPPLAFAKRLPNDAVNSFCAVKTRICAADRPRPSDVRPDLPRSLDRVVEGALEADRTKRIQSARDLAHQVDVALRDIEVEHDPEGTAPTRKLHAFKTTKLERRPAV